MSELPFLSCVCPTYKRPDLLANALACFQLQDYPADRCELLILDDAGQFDSQFADNWMLISETERIPSLWHKYNLMIRSRDKADVIVIWEDDDIYLPHHLSAIAAASTACLDSRQILVAGKILTNCGLPRGQVKEEPQLGGHHGCWAFTKSLYEHVGGYDPTPGRLGSDLTMGAALRQHGTLLKYCDAAPSYVYRWGNGSYHGSQAGEQGFQQLWDNLGNRPAPFIGELIPQLDRETEQILTLCGFRQ